MDKKQLKGEYLAPHVKVVEVESHQMLCLSEDMQVSGNPFDFNQETEW